MSARGISSGYGLPPNPAFIDFPVSDGDESQWPTNTTRVLDSEGHVNYMRSVPIDESLSIKWRCEVGASLASQLKKPAGPSYVLHGWPAGYQMYDHNKGPASSPRHDAYLIGSRHAKRFRSIPEFIPHALWLLTDPTLNRANCHCKYCNKKPQREITASMGLHPRRSTPLSAPPPSRGLTSKNIVTATAASSFTSPPVRQLRERVKPFAAIRRMPRPVKQTQGPKQNILRERNADLRAAYAEGVYLRKWYRDGELLWCALNSPIPGLTGEKDAITFWPGLVEEARMKADAVRRPDTTGGGASGLMQANAPQSGESSGMIPNGNTPHMNREDEDKQVPWTVIQTLSYKVKLLGIPYSYYIPADQVLPYQAHAPSDELIQAIHRVSLEQMNTDTNAFRLTAVSTFVEAAASFALAVQIAANLAGYWAPTDDWEYKFSIPPPGAPPAMVVQPLSTNGAQSQTSLDSVMNASMTFNASLTGVGGAGPSTLQTSLVPPVPVSISAPPPIALTQTVTQTRYQGLWWGAERIWTDELVRLKLSRAQIAPEGAENILPPAGPSRKALEYTRTLNDTEGDGEAVVGAETRGVFMRIDGLYVADIPRMNGSTGKECRATGMLYELVDEDWEGNLVEGVANGDTGGKGKGRAIEVSSGTSTPATSVNGTNTDAAAVDVNSHAMVGVSAPKERSASEQLSHPILSSPFPLPPPPEGFKFRPILAPGHEAVLSLNLIAGRYYPRLLRHPLLDSCVERALDIATGEVVETSQLWALEGLAPGYYNTMDPVRWRPSRVAMVREADKEARQGLEEHWRARARERDEKLTVEVGYLPPQQLPGSMPMDMNDDVGMSASHAPDGAQVQDNHLDAMEVDS
ncbi:hypothetical protein PAXINDRAFT_106682 [Paxillus involutus ATCC 200175]|nr:hypothetical protein PAXINDRAFT_106682 [Paxillus involutus ATCC 200175]